MLPIRLEIKNFLPYTAPDPLYFDGMHLACLTGPNGAGKSSLLDAITWVLWGKARARYDEDLIHQGQQEMLVQLDFEQEGLIYRVIRKRTRRQRSTGTLDLLARDETGQYTVISEPNVRATQERINQLLRLDYETFVNSAFLQQGRADAFTIRTPKERKQILADILGLAQWEQYEEAAKAQAQQIGEQLNLYTARIQEIETELKEEPRLLAEQAEALAAEAEARAALAAAEQQAAELAHVPRELEQARQRQDEIAQRIGRIEQEIAAAQADMQRHQEQVTRFEATIAVQDDIETGYALLETARAADRELGEKLQQLRQFDTQQHTLENQIRAAQAELEQVISNHQTRIAELERDAAAQTADSLASVQAEIDSLRQREADRQRAQDETSVLKTVKADLEATNRALKEQMNTLKDRLNRLEQADGATCPLCGQPLDAAHRAELIEQLNAEGRQQGDTYRANSAQIKAIEADVKAYTQQISEWDVELRRLQPLIERAGRLQTQAERAAAAQARIQQEQQAMAAVIQRLHTGDFAHDSRAALAELEAQRAAIGYSQDSHASARADLQTYQEYERRKFELDHARQALPAAAADLQAAQERFQRQQTALEDDCQQLSALHERIGQLEAQKLDYEARQQVVMAQRKAVDEARGRSVSAQQALNALENQRQRKADLEQRAAAARHQKSLYEELRLAFSKNGIPAMLIETAIPELENAANDLLRRMTDGRMALSFSTQREKKTGGMAETLDIQIADELGTRDYDLYSGGEAFRINFAIRVALSQMLARRAGAHLRTLFIDEGFGTQDADGRDRLVEAINAIQDSFDLILIITHIDELRDHFPVHIVVEKLAGGSRVTVR
jgi:exonuclease SbcC